jgi:hypothetical protein
MFDFFWCHSNSTVNDSDLENEVIAQVIDLRNHFYVTLTLEFGSIRDDITENLM